MTNYVAMDLYIMGSVSDKIYDLKREKQMMTAEFQDVETKAPFYVNKAWQTDPDL